MKFDVIEHDVQAVGVIHAKEVTISGNAKAFELIFGQIYPDIIKAIVRELFANGWDSQKMANNLETPIDIHLPSNIEPYFSVRDYGTGMSPEIMDKIYTSTFESTKDEDNEGVGQFGIGSKTPWGYTTTYNLTSFIDGTYWAYINYISSTGNPICALVATGETTGPNGVLVSLPVKTEDFGKFASHAEVFSLNAGTPVNINRKKSLNKHGTIKDQVKRIIKEVSEMHGHSAFPSASHSSTNSAGNGVVSELRNLVEDCLS